MFKIDLHTHILPKEWPDLKKRYGYGGFIRLQHDCCKSGNAKMFQDDKFFREVAPNSWDPLVRLKECDKDGVTVQVLSTVPVMFSYWADPEDTLDLCRILNDHIADICKQFPKRFVGLATLPMQAPELALQELDRCVNKLGMRGIQIATHINDWNLDAPELFPIFSAVEKFGVSIFVHPWDIMGKSSMEKYWLPWLVGMPAESSRAICSLIFGGVMEKLPKLKFCFAHGGGSFPSTIGRIEHGHRCRPDLVAIDNAHNPRKYLGKFWLDSLVHDPVQLDHIVKLVGQDKVVLGTDYPFPLGEWVPGSLIESMKWSDEQKSKLLWKNGLDFLGLDESDFVDSVDKLNG
uniref:2-amino-3-carboxymuconate-6-semialdehyde decarboxylase n=1 Tax=Hirondellea gigas TaxID=1518452 RepID=A0A6A7GE65_9CRUS